MADSRTLPSTSQLTPKRAIWPTENMHPRSTSTPPHRLQSNLPYCTGQDSLRTFLIQVASASGYYNEEVNWILHRFKYWILTSHTIAPALQFLALASLRQPASVVVSIKPLVASLAAAGFPMTSLFMGTPEDAISKTDVLGQVLDDWVSKPAQVVYSCVPSGGMLVSLRSVYKCKSLGYLRL